ncbi:MAG: hypothetical protein WC551_04275 [Patescibacteria group bacterium]
MLRKNMHLSVAVFVSVLSGCALEPSSDDRASANQTVGSAGSGRNFDLDPVVVVSRISQKGKDRGIIGEAKPQGSSEPEPQMAEDDIPTNLLFVTCESGPTEVAVPLNADTGKFCDTVQVYPYRSDDNGSYGVSGSEVVWDMPGDGVANFYGPAFGPGGSARRISAATDAFWWGDTWDEPETLLTVCVKPPASMPHAYAPICRSLPVRATINIEGAWCFSGTTFSSNCQDVEIKQDGRGLSFDGDVLASGLLWVRSVTFNRDNDYEYAGVLDSHDYMYGIVRQNGQTEVLGTWTAWKLPLY